MTQAKKRNTIGQAIPNTKDKILSEIVLTVEDVDPLELFGQNNSKLNLFRKAFPEVVVTSRGNQVKLSGKKKLAQSAKDKFEMMLRILKDQKTLPMATLEDLLAGTHTFEQEETPVGEVSDHVILYGCLLYTSPSPRDRTRSRMPSSA